MTTMSTLVIIQANAEAFIIPNKAHTVSGWCNPEQKAERMHKLCMFNGRQFDEEHDKLVDLWIHSKDLNTENLADHSGWFFDEDGIRIPVHVREHFIPSQMLEGCKEGDTITLRLPAKVTVENDDQDSENNFEDIDAIAELTITLRQQGYRYARFGKFEEVLQSCLQG